MNKVLHIIATPRGEESRTLKVSREFINVMKKDDPGIKIEDINVFNENLQPLTVQMVPGKYALLSGKDIDAKLKGAWKNIERYIYQFLSADIYIISTPMWNFSIPYPLKQYIDIILQPKYLFRYTPDGVEGLAKNKKMIVITSRGGDYSPESSTHGFDFQEPYLRTVFGFVGIKDITFINAQPMDMGADMQNAALEKAKVRAREAGAAF